MIEEERDQAGERNRPTLKMAEFMITHTNDNIKGFQKRMSPFEGQKYADLLISNNTLIYLTLLDIYGRASVKLTISPSNVFILK